MRIEIYPGIVEEGTKIMSTIILSPDNYGQEMVCIEVEIPMPRDGAEYLRNEGFSDAKIADFEKHQFVYSLNEWDFRSAQLDAEERIDCALKNGYISLCDLEEI